MGFIEQTTHQPYLLGRLFAVLEAIQLRAKPGYNSTINHFSMAGVRPCSAFPKLLVLNEMHLQILDRYSRVYYDKLLCEIIGKMTEDFPEHLSLKDKGRFQVSYFHQRQKLLENEDIKDDA